MRIDGQMLTGAPLGCCGPLKVKKETLCRFYDVKSSKCDDTVTRHTDTTLRWTLFRVLNTTNNGDCEVYRFVWFSRKKTGHKETKNLSRRHRVLLALLLLSALSFQVFVANEWWGLCFRYLYLLRFSLLLRTGTPIFWNASFILLDSYRFWPTWQLWCLQIHYQSTYASVLFQEHPSSLTEHLYACYTCFRNTYRVWQNICTHLIPGDYS
jgi:hypothetical protein